MNLAEEITVIIPTSPIPSHPSTSLIELAIASIRKQLPDCLIMIQADGVRPEQEKFRDQYVAYKLRLWELINARKFGWCKMQEFPEFRHQAAMMKETIDKITTPLLFYYEHDFILLPEYVDWRGIVNAIHSKEVNKIRLYYWSSIVPDNKHLMLDEEPVFICGVPLIRTVQWSQHPHVTSVEFYKSILSQFSENCRTMIETYAYSIIANIPWEQTRCAIYAPMPYLKRLSHIHGREEEDKFEGTFVF